MDIYNILITGADGQLGNCLKEAVDSTTRDTFYFTDVGELDITNRKAINEFVIDNNINIIVNCAAYTNVDKAEEDYDKAELLNSTAVRFLADAIKNNNGWIFHISTDYIFGGSKQNTPIKETDRVCPSSVYGLTKLHGENQILDRNTKHLILRTAWLYSPYGKNFVKTMLELFLSKVELKVVFDQVGTPTYAIDLANAIFDIIDNRKFIGNEGVYHFSNEGICSWYDFAQMISQITDNKSCNILPCLSAEFPSKVIRPNYSVLDKSKFKQTFGIEIPFWYSSLEDCIHNINVSN